MNEDARSPPAAETAENKQAIGRLLVFFALVYVVEGLGQIGGLISQPLNYYSEGSPRLDAVQVTAFVTVFNLPWIIKPVYGLISDFVPLFGYRRKSYLIIANIAAIAGYFGRARSPSRATSSSRLCSRPMPWRFRARCAAPCWWRTASGCTRAARSSISNGCGSTSPRWRPPFSAASLLNALRSDIGIACRRGNRRGRAVAGHFRDPVSDRREESRRQHARHQADAQWPRRGVSRRRTLGRRGFHVSLLFQSRLEHAALFSHDGRSALLTRPISASWDRSPRPAGSPARCFTAGSSAGSP
jgi:hypothetical protein